MDFKAELKQVQSRKTQSNDIVYKLVLETDNVNIMDLGKLPSDSLFEISVTLYNNTEQIANKQEDGYHKI